MICNYFKNDKCIIKGESTGVSINYPEKACPLHSHNIDEDNFNYINEKCSICGCRFKNIKQIFVHGYDTYICKTCSKKYNLKVQPAIENYYF
ncbi:MAG: hypothetical protein WDA21_05745 [Bacilli bacterium]